MRTDALRHVRHLVVVALLALISGLLHVTVTPGAGAAPVPWLSSLLGGTLPGRGEPGPGAHVTLHQLRPDGTTREVLGLQTDADGQWRVPVSPGRYQVHARTFGGTMALAPTAGSGEEWVEITDRS